MRVLIFNSSLRHGGVERQIGYLRNGLAARGHEVPAAVLTTSGSRGPDEHFLSWPGFFDPGLRKLVGLPRLLRQLRHLVIRLQPDLIHTWGPYENLTATLVGSRLRVPVVTSVRGIGSWQFKFARYWAPASARVTVNAAAVCEKLVREYDVSPDQLMLVRNALDVERYPYNPVRYHHGGQVRLTVVGRLSPIKNQLLLVRALPELLSAHPDRGLKVLFVGSEERSGYRSQVEAEVADLGLSDLVEIRPYTDDITRVYRETDVLVLPSRKEGLPNVLLEAMAMGTPWIATDIVDNEWLAGHDGERGLLFPDNSVQGLLRALSSVLRAEPAEIAQRARRGRQFVEEAFSPTRMVAEFEAIYRDVVRRHA